MEGSLFNPEYLNNYATRKYLFSCFQVLFLHSRNVKRGCQRTKEVLLSFLTFANQSTRTDSQAMRNNPLSG